MKPEQQRIAIAELCGIFQGDSAYFFEEWVKSLPDYLNDLNAMHEAEKALTDDQAWEQVKIIVDYRQAANDFPLLSRSETLKLHSATAAQRAEAFLRTMGRREE